LPGLQAATELLSVLRMKGGYGALLASAADPGSSLSGLEDLRAKTLRVYGTELALAQSSILGTSAEIRMIREPGSNYAEMMVGW
jgi:hypothetical protein